jgi:hypothetical protein
LLEKTIQIVTAHKNLIETNAPKPINPFRPTPSSIAVSPLTKVFLVTRIIVCIACRCKVGWHNWKEISLHVKKIRPAAKFIFVQASAIAEGKQLPAGSYGSQFVHMLTDCLPFC